MKTFLMTIVFLIIIIYIIVMRKLKADVQALGNEDFDLSVASYKPKITAGNYKVIITVLGADMESTIKTINRYREQPVTNITVNTEVVSDVSIYTAEDLVYELQYIGADADIIEQGTNVIV